MMACLEGRSGNSPAEAVDDNASGWNDTLLMMQCTGHALSCYATALPSLLRVVGERGGERLATLSAARHRVPLLTPLA